MSLLARWRNERALAALAKTDFPRLKAYGEAQWPAPDTLASEAPYLALDFELDGLRKGAHLLQAGWTPFEGTKIRLDEARGIDIRSYAELDRDAVTIHGIGEERAAQGVPIVDAIRAVLTALSGRIMVAHAASIEHMALTAAVRSLTGMRLPIRMVCTLTLERRLHPNLGAGDAYRLATARARYGLPEYQPHDALTDAMAAAELFQAQLSHMHPSTRLADLEIS